MLGRRRLIVALLSAVAMTGCSSSGGGSPATSPRPSTRAQPRPSARSYATTPLAVAASCAAFGRFSVDLNRLTPRGSQITLVADAQEVLAPLLHTYGPLAASAAKLFDDANNFVAHIGSSDWPSNGTPVDPEIQAVAADCAQRRVRVRSTAASICSSRNGPTRPHRNLD